MSLETQYEAAQRRKLKDSMTRNPRVKITNHPNTSAVTGDIHHLRSWANANGIRVEGRGRPSKELITKYEKSTGRQYVSGKVVSKPVSETRGPVARKKVYRPNCINHKIEMVFDTNDNLFKCPRKDCVIKALPKADANKPIVGTGVLKFMQEGMKVYITADNGVRMDITNYIRDGFDIVSGFGTPPMVTFEIRLEVRD